MLNAAKGRNALMPEERRVKLIISELQKNLPDGGIGALDLSTDGTMVEFTMTDGGRYALPVASFLEIYH